MEACWAHNPEFRGSKPRSASKSFLPITIFKGVLLPVYLFFASINLKETHAIRAKRRRTRLDRQLREGNDTLGSRIVL